jgi:hypothetical protein
VNPADPIYSRAVRGTWKIAVFLIHELAPMSGAVYALALAADNAGHRPVVASDDHIFVRWQFPDDFGQMTLSFFQGSFACSSLYSSNSREEGTSPEKPALRHLDTGVSHGSNIGQSDERRGSGAAGSHSGQLGCRRQGKPQGFIVVFEGDIGKEPFSWTDICCRARVINRQESSS